MQIKIFFILFLIFICFCVLQIYFYNTKYHKNKKWMKKVESFENTVKNIHESSHAYILDDNSLETLLNDYEELKKSYN